MGLKRKVGGGVVAAVGYILSPLSWWNDLWVNVPLALAFAWGVSLVYKPAFFASAVLGYWITNILGFVLLHKGAQQMLTKEGKKYGTPRPGAGCGDFTALHGPHRVAGEVGRSEAGHGLFSQTSLREVKI